MNRGICFSTARDGQKSKAPQTPGSREEGRSTDLEDRSSKPCFVIGVACLQKWPQPFLPYLQKVPAGSPLGGGKSDSPSLDLSLA